MPRQQQPDLLRLEYYKALLPFVHAITGAFGGVRAEVLALYVADRRAHGIMDASRGDDMKRLITKAERMAEDDFTLRRLEETARRFGQRVSGFQREQLDIQVRAALSVPLRMVEVSTVAKLEGFAAENASLIRGLSQRYFDRIREDVLEAFENGTHPNDLAELFEERDGMAERDARRIARDQIGKLNASFNQERQEQLGVTGYIWRTMNDNRVRDEHRDRDGRHYSWSNAPHDGHPGQAIQCRCYAEPDLTPILDEL